MVIADILIAVFAAFSLGQILACNAGGCLFHRGRKK